MNATSTTSEYQRDAKMLRSLVSYVTQPCESGQGVLVPSRSHFEDESCLQGVGAPESALHLMDSVRSSSLEMEACVPESFEACVLHDSGLGVQLHATGSTSDVGSITQSSKSDKTTCIIHDLSFRTVKSERDILLPPHMFEGEPTTSSCAHPHCSIRTTIPSWMSNVP